MIRKRGGQPGNRNAFKHGFYSDQFKQAEKSRLNQLQRVDLTDEIELFRIQLRRYLESETVALDRIDYQTRLQALHTFSLAAESFARLIRTQALLNSGLIGPENGQGAALPAEDAIRDRK